MLKSLRIAIPLSESINRKPEGVCNASANAHNAVIFNDFEHVVEDIEIKVAPLEIVKIVRQQAQEES